MVYVRPLKVKMSWHSKGVSQGKSLRALRECESVASVQRE